MKQVVLVSHGTDSPEGSGSITALAEYVDKKLPGHRVSQAYVDVQKPELSDVLGTILEQDDQAEITVVPLFLGAGFHVKNDIAEAIIGAEKQITDPARSQIQLAAALNDPQLVANLALAKLASLQPLAGDIVVFTTAGSSDLAAQQKARANFELVSVALLEQYPGVRAELAFLSAAEPLLKDLVPKLKFQNPRSRVLVSTHLLATGYFHRLAQKAGAHAVAGPWLELELAPPEALVDQVAELSQPTGKRLGCALTAERFQALANGRSCAEGCLKPCTASEN